MKLAASTKQERPLKRSTLRLFDEFTVMRLIAWNIEVMYETCTHYKAILKKCMGHVI